MADVQKKTRSPSRGAAARPAYPRSPSAADTAWLGWVIFVGILLFCSGLLTAVQGVVALVDDDFYQVTASGLAIGADYVVWGWTLLVVGVGLMAAGIGIVLGLPWARVVGIVAAAINALVNLAFAARAGRPAARPGSARARGRS